LIGGKLAGVAVSENPILPMPVISKGLEGIVASSTAGDVLGTEGFLSILNYNISSLPESVLRRDRLSSLAGELPNRPELDELKSQLQASGNFRRAWSLHQGRSSRANQWT
jgi:hypothetical protein